MSAPTTSRAQAGQAPRSGTDKDGGRSVKDVIERTLRERGDDSTLKWLSDRWPAILLGGLAWIPLTLLVMQGTGFLSSPFLHVVLLGFLLGAGELMGRYRDEPLKIFRCRYTWYYVAINGALAAASLFLIRTLGLSFIPEVPADGVAVSTASAKIYDVLMAGFGGAAFFRSSVMKTRVSGADIPVGPAIVLDTILQVTDREVDRWRAKTRGADITRTMAGVTQEDMSGAVIPFACALMQNLSPKEREDLKAEALKLNAAAGDTKKMELGLSLASSTGFELLEGVIEVLKEERIIGVGGNAASLAAHNVARAQFLGDLRKAMNEASLASDWERLKPLLDKLHKQRREARQTG